MKRLLTIMFVLLPLVVVAQALHFHQLTVKDGLSHNSILTLAEDGKGDIWVATRSGLLRYDGLQFTVLPADGLPDKRVDRINRAKDGTMWVQCFECHSQVSRYDTLTNKFITYNVSDLNDSIRQEAVQPLNRTFSDPRSSRGWTIEKRQLWQTDSLRPDSPLIYTGQTALDAGLKDETFYSLLLDRHGILWAGSANNGLFFAYTHPSRYRRMVCQPSPMVRVTHVDSKGSLWIAISDQQLLTLPKGASAYTHVDYPMTDSVEGRRLRSIVEDEKGRLWMGSHDGLYVKDAAATNFRHLVIEEGNVVPVYCLCLDKNEDLWIGTDRGLYLLKINEEKTSVEHIDSTITSISKIAVDGKRLWMATEKGLYCRTGNETTKWYEEATRAVVTDARGQIWVGTDNGLLQITEQGVLPMSTAADGHVVKNLLCWRDFLWCSHEQGLCCINIYTGQSTILHIEHNEYLDGSACIDAKTGTLYFGGTMGLDCLQADSLQEQLRSGRPQLWLEEVSEEIAMMSEKADKPLWPYVVLPLLLVCVAFLFIYYKKKHKNTPTEMEQPLLKEPSPFILKAKAIAEAHIADTEFTAEQMAQELAMSRTKLFMLMKNETGKAVMEFVRDIRLEYAARQLEAGTPVNETYMACGFSDPSSFRRAFVKKYGINPSQYRATK